MASLKVSMKHCIFLNKEGHRYFLTHVFQPTTVKTESRIRHRQKQTNEEKTANKQKQTNPPTKQNMRNQNKPPH